MGQKKLEEAEFLLSFINCFLCKSNTHPYNPWSKLCPPLSGKIVNFLFASSSVRGWVILSLHMNFQQKPHHHNFMSQLPTTSSSNECCFHEKGTQQLRVSMFIVPYIGLNKQPFDQVGPKSWRLKLAYVRVFWWQKCVKLPFLGENYYILWPLGDHLVIIWWPFLGDLRTR